MRPIKYWKQKLLFTAGYLFLIFLSSQLGIGCIYRKFLGIVCPGCGMSRAVVAALHFDFSAAFRYHFMFWSVPILYLYFLFDDGLFREKKLDRAVLTLIGIGFMIHWIISLLSMSYL